MWSTGSYQLFNATFLRAVIIDEIFDVGGRLFLASLKMLVVPLVFVSLVKGICSLGDIRKLGNLGVQSFLLYICTTALAIGFAIILSNLLKPGEGFDLSSSKEFAVKAAPP